MRGGEGMGGKGRGGEVEMLQTYRLQTSDIQTYRPSDEAGPRGAFDPKNTILVVGRGLRSQIIIVCFMDAFPIVVHIFKIFLLLPQSVCSC